MKHYLRLKSAILIMSICMLFNLYSCNNKEVIEYPPSVSSIQPASGGYGTELTISGSNFSANISDNIVTIGGINVDVISATSTKLTVSIPSLTEGDLPVNVSTEAGVANAGYFKYVYDVFVAGYEKNADGFMAAKYWKNGTPVVLTNGELTVVSEIAVSGNNVYVVGTNYKSSTKKIMFWVNGVETKITESVSGAFGIFLNGNDIYLCGYESNGSKDIATYWKNGTAVPLTNGSTNAQARAITVSNGDVYCTGFEYNESRGVAKYWKNSNPVILTDGQKSATGRDIAVIGNDVYVCGVENANSIETAKYWKNGVETTLGDGVNNSNTFSMAVKGTTTYIVGSEDGIGRYWKDGVITSFAQNESKAYPSSVFLINDDVYIAGWLENDITKAVYWKNGVQILLTDGTYSASATSIFIR